MNNDNSDNNKMNLSPTATTTTKKRHHEKEEEEDEDDDDDDKKEDIVPVDGGGGPKKLCLLSSENNNNNDNDSVARAQQLSKAQEEESSHEHLMHLLQQKEEHDSTGGNNLKNNLLIVFAENGGLLEFHQLFEHLFQTNQIDMFALRVLLDFWMLFPESAEEDILPWFAIVDNAWQQLLLLMQLSKDKGSSSSSSSSKVLKKQVYKAVLKMMKKQWDKDSTFVEESLQHQHQHHDSDEKQLHGTSETLLSSMKYNNNNNNASRRSTNIISISKMALWLPRERSKWDKELDFVRRFTRVIYPNQRLAAKSLYRKHVKLLTRIRKEIDEATTATSLSSSSSSSTQPLEASSIGMKNASYEQIQPQDVQRTPLTSRWRPPPSTNNNTTTTTVGGDCEFPFSFETLIRLPKGGEKKRSLLSSARKSIISATNNKYDENSDNKILTLPRIGRVDHHFMTDTYMTQAGELFLQKGTRHFASKTSEERILYIHQGEMGHATPDQCDVIVGDRATTCHVLAIRSEPPTTTFGGASSSSTKPLTSLAHVDGPIYDDCIQSMVETHIAHHRGYIDDDEEEDTSMSSEYEDEKDAEQNTKSTGSCNRANHRQEAMLDIQVHVCGGFDDDRHSSERISEWLMHLLAWLAEEYQDEIRLTLKTCVISSMNDTGDAAPVGRGMGIDLRSGEAFLAKVDSEVCGPAQQVRNARIWSRGDGTLNLIHTATSNDIIIRPFHFQGCTRHEEYLRLPNHNMILRTSTSPDVEEDDFCSSVRATLRFMRGVDCTKVFGPNLDEIMVFRRVGISNSFKRVLVNQHA